MTAVDRTPPTVFGIEALRAAHVADHSTGLMRDRQTLAWLRVGEIVADPDAPYFHHRDALVAWVAEQDDEPPLGVYRVLETTGLSMYAQEFELRRGDLVIERVERPEPARYSDGSVDDTSRALDVVADALAAPGVEER